MPGFPAAVKYEGQRLYLGTFQSQVEATTAKLIALAELRHTTPDLPATIPAEQVALLTGQVRTRLAAYTRPHRRQATRLRSDNTRGLRGVFSTTKPWKSEIAVGGRKFWLGSFHTQYEAALAYNEAALLIHGPDAILNSIPTEHQPTPERAEQIRHEVAKRLVPLTVPTPALVG
jgi:hypothetical protein